MAAARSFKLRTGYEMPAIGLGTWQSKPHEVEEAVVSALRCGYRHIDAAACYGNEDEVGNGIAKSGVPREQIFITSKLWNTHHEPQRVEEAFEKSLRDLKVDYLDLYLVHWPISFRYSQSSIQPIDEATGMIDTIDVPIEETWAAMEKLVDSGRVRSIGVSNFTQSRLESLMKKAKIMPAVNQIEAHPYLQQKDLLEWSKQNDILITGYSPLGNNIYDFPRVVDDPTVTDLARSLNKSPAQLLINWAVQRGTAVVPKSVTPARIASNLEEFMLPEKVFYAIESLEKNFRMNNPVKTGVDVFGGFGEENAKRSAREWAEAQRRMTQVS